MVVWYKLLDLERFHKTTLCLLPYLKDASKNNHPVTQRNETMTDLNQIFNEIKDTPHLEPKKVEQLALELLAAPTEHITTSMIVNAVLLHPNISRSLYDLMLDKVDETAFSGENNTLYLLFNNNNTTLDDVQRLRNFAEKQDATEWFEKVVSITIDYNKYHLALSYNGELMVQDAAERSQLSHSVDVLESYCKSSGGA